MDRFGGLSGRESAPKGCLARQEAVFTLQFHLNSFTQFVFFPPRGCFRLTVQTFFLLFIVLFFLFYPSFFGIPSFALNNEYWMPTQGVRDIACLFIGVAVIRIPSIHVCQLL